MCGIVALRGTLKIRCSYVEDTAIKIQVLQYIQIIPYSTEWLFL